MAVKLVEGNGSAEVWVGEVGGMTLWVGRVMVWMYGLFGMLIWNDGGDRGGVWSEVFPV